MRYRYVTCDVFAEHRFGGNQLAVLPDATGMTTATMQAIAREFNYAETTFVTAPDDPSCTRKVRIFTPGAEIPFAGHPNVGTAFVLAAIGAIPAGQEAVLFEEHAGKVPVTIRYDGGAPVFAELTAPQALTLGAAQPVERVAASLSLAPDQVLTTVHPPQTASAGLPFLMVEVGDRAALAAARVDHDAHAALMPAAGAEGVLVYTRDSGTAGIDLRARVYVPLHGVTEDAATGSANVALAGLLAGCAPEPDGEFRLSIHQGIELGRPSVLATRVTKRGGTPEALRIGGRSILVCEGELEAG